MSRGADLSLSFSLLLSPSMIPFRSPFPFFSPRKTNYPSDHRLVAGKQETRKKRGERRETFERLIIRGSTAQQRFSNARLSESGNIRALLPLPALGLHGHEYTGCPVIRGCRENCDKQRELNSPLHSISSESNLESV